MRRAHFPRPLTASAARREAAQAGKCVSDLYDLDFSTLPKAREEAFRPEPPRYLRQMAYFRLSIQGDSDRARGLLAVQGIQNIVADDGGVAARLQADDAEAAVERVQAALKGESFTVVEAQQEGP